MKSVYIFTFFYKIGKSENQKVSVLKFTLQPFMAECPVAVILSSIPLPTFLGFCELFSIVLEEVTISK